MKLTEPIKLYNTNKKQLLLNLINILKSTTKSVKKGKKKVFKIFFILKYIIESLKISNFYYLKVLEQLNFLWRYESSKFLIFISKIHIKSETLAMKNVIPTAKNMVFLDTCFWIRVGRLRYIDV